MRGYTAKKGNRYYAVIYEGVDPATGKERRRWYPAGTRKPTPTSSSPSSSSAATTAITAPPTSDPRRLPHRRWLPAQRAQLQAEHVRLVRAQHRAPRHSRARQSPRPARPRISTASTAGCSTQGGERSGGGRPQPRAVRYIHRHPAQGAGDAVRKGRPPERGRSRRSAEARDEAEHDMRVWTADTAQTFLLGSGHRLHPAFFLAAHTGMRRGEVLGLRWADVDLDAPAHLVRQADHLSVTYELRPPT